ncbi:MAG: hypothetical protein CO183_02165 [Candidatus Zambryskibacteria bacterium CG_4_9_14_3_um_filter_42_9]|uniref:Uncharacterized protein n=1 Tax=Candidatus Zambryskibacteria bacterium CG22_combo_CG10-13_8_21_14_all_42_17 TaxID=1975118 RepID=A0A2H0BDW7_9BACT|nr:MAG: hypothetical protein COX06_01140 [Candidatus Zambryskibacteria bacterium CG22_combo_CG10-13_8_21_14_all_42_17]PJA36686.1 MAG: hypothetical protein CO183_02165 [Candidatus Zambryskibacteria bacterium CG_4_9_14_3_um_filter_42_9]
MEGQENNANINKTEGEGTSGPIIGLIVILAIIILGGLYFWGQRANNDSAINQDLGAINSQSEEDTSTSIETDLEATDIENIDAELNAY